MRDLEFEVGYKRPPTGTQWKKGQSGNPGGRRPASKNARDIARQALTRLVWIVRDGKRQRVTRLEAVFEKIVEDAIHGNATARRILLDYIKSDPTLARPERVLRAITEDMSAEEASRAYAETLRDIDSLMNLNEDNPW